MAEPGRPVLDLRRFDAGPLARERFLADLRQAARAAGFLCRGAWRSARGERAGSGCARDFFSLPEANKLAIAMVNSPHFRGYTRAGGEITRSRPDWREQIDVGAEQTAAPRDAGLPAWAGCRTLTSGRPPCRTFATRCCAEGDGLVTFQQWDGKPWKVISDWIAPDWGLLRPIIEQAAQKYAKEKGIAPQDCAADQKS